MIPPLLKNKIKPIILDKNPNCFLSKKEYDFIQCDISKPEECFNAIKDKNIVACFTAQSDIGVPSQGLINSKFELIGVKSEIARIASNKFLFRELMAKNQISQPKYFKCFNRLDVINSIKELGFPSVIKSVDSSGSRGISIIKSIKQIDSSLKYALENSRENYFLEEYIEGIEYESDNKY